MHATPPLLSIVVSLSSNHHYVPIPPRLLRIALSYIYIYYTWIAYSLFFFSSNQIIYNFERPFILR